MLAGNKILDGFDQQMAGFVVKAMTVKGIVVTTGSDCSIQKEGAMLSVNLKTNEQPNNICREIFHTVLFASDRRAPLQNLRTDEADVSTNAGKIVVDSSFRTTCPNIFALGMLFTANQNWQQSRY